MEFLTIHETLPASDADGEKKRGRKKARTVIGQLGQGKNTLSGIIDIALMQSLGKTGEVKEFVKNYGMIIVDECHHVAAFSFENILKNAKAKYIYGLTATPTRKDGQHPIIFMALRAQRSARQIIPALTHDPRFSTWLKGLSPDNREDQHSQKQQYLCFNFIKEAVNLSSGMKEDGRLPERNCAPLPREFGTDDQAKKSPTRSKRNASPIPF
jgi:hypothetical protein